MVRSLRSSIFSPWKGSNIDMLLVKLAHLQDLHTDNTMPWLHALKSCACHCIRCVLLVPCIMAAHTMAEWHIEAQANQQVLAHEHSLQFAVGSTMSLVFCHAVHLSGHWHICSTASLLCSLSVGMTQQTIM